MLCSDSLFNMYEKERVCITQMYMCLLLLIVSINIKQSYPNDAFLFSLFGVSTFTQMLCE